MEYLLGEYESTVDPKGRFLLPAGLKKQLPEEENTQFVMIRGIERCITLYPMATWKPLMAKITKLNSFNSKVREFRRTFLGGAMQVDLDSAGRLLLSKSLMEYASMDKELVIAAAGDKIEIWDKKKYYEFFDKHTPESFSQLADEVMGQQFDDDLDLNALKDLL